MENKKEFYIAACRTECCEEFIFISTDSFSENDIDKIKKVLTENGDIDYVNVKENYVEIIGKTSDVKYELTEFIPGIYKYINKN